MAARSALIFLGVVSVAGLPQPAPAQRASRFHPRWEIPGFDFSSGGVWRGRAQRIRANRARLLANRQFRALNAPAVTGVLSSTVVSGTIVEPVVLFKYNDTPPAEIIADTLVYDSVLYATTPPNGRPYTVRTYYEQLTTLDGNAPLVTITGKSFGFVALSQNEVAYTGTPGTRSGNPYGNTNCNGLFSGAAVQQMQSGLREALGFLDNGVDWTQFSSHGDTLDLVVFVQPAKDGACGGATNNHIWAHRYVLLQPYMTHSGLQVVDYIVQSGVGGASSCDPTEIMPVGTVAHETAHGFGLPDLYDTDPLEASYGVGDYSLMGSGVYASPLSPARLDSWSLSQLGWVTVVPLTSEGAYVFGGAPVSVTTFYVRVTDPNFRGEYFLLENRQPLQSDSAMIGMHGAGGLLIWHVDSIQMANHGFSADNAVNAGPIHGLELEQADHRRDLDLGRNHGDAGDPYPGVTGNPAFAPAKNVDLTYAGFVIDSIRQVETTGRLTMALRLAFGAPLLSTADVVAQLLTGSGLPAAALDYLDVGGNRNGQFDVGDFLAWVNATGAPLTSQQRQLVAARRAAGGSGPR